MKRILVSLVCVVAAWATLLAQETAFKIAQHDERQVVVDFLPPQYAPEPVLVEGEVYVRYRSATSGTRDEVGKPDLPIEATLVALPPNKRPIIEVLESRYESAAEERMAPVPRKTLIEEGREALEYELDTDFYSAFNRFYPSQGVEVGEVTQLRNQSVARLTVAPMQYNPVAKQLRRLVHLKVRIRFEDMDAGEWVPFGATDPHFENVYRSLILNYDDGKGWRGYDRAIQPPPISDTTGGWFRTGRQYYRIPVVQDKMYRITAGTLLQAGINPALVDFPTLAIYNKGKSIPVSIGNQGNLDSVYIDFYGRRNYGSSSYYDLYSDTSAYFLTWNDTSARRYLIEPPVTVPVQIQPSWYLEKLHVEKDSNYYFGYTDTLIMRTDDVPGEGWYWVDFFPGNVKTFPFTVDTLLRGVGTASLTVRVNGMSGFFNVPDHLAEFRINGTVIGQVGFNGDQEAIFTESFPDTVLRVGSNVFEVRSLTTASPVNKFYLDWFRVDFPRPFRATNNELLFSYPAVAGGAVEFSIRGLAADTIDVFDLNGGRKLSSVGGSADDIMATILFRDTLSVAKTYIVVGRIARAEPIRLASKTFSNLRNRTNGADYIVITHRRFRSAAEQLAQRRRSASSLRTATVDVQDIYDEFNFGYKSALPVRDFLRYTYYYWRAPSPTYVLLMGDACWDYRRNLWNSIKTDYVPSYGNPPSDNALVSFHPVKNYLPYMFIGRIPAEDSIPAQRVVNKIIGYDNPPVDEWGKSFLFVTGGTNATERRDFNGYSDTCISRHVLPSPVGGVPYRVYKSSDAVIDGEFRDSIRNMVRRGLLFYNFIGHSGGRTWNVDAGSPNDFPNTDGRLFFLNSVSCWIGFFSEPRSNVLGEDFLFADNRAAVAVWGSSTLDDARTGYFLTLKYLSSLRQDYARSFGQLTTISLINFWLINSNTTPPVIATLHQHPLLGDPYSQMALPLKPDLAFKDSAMALNTHSPTSDSTVTLKVRWWNYGLVPTDSVLLTINDAYTDEYGVFRGVRSVIPPIVAAPTRTRDSVLIAWNVRGQAGTHVLTARLDSLNRIPELSESNNIIQQSFYIYRNVIAAITPPAHTNILGASAALTATTPSTNDTTPLQYFFEIDTVADFSSGWKRSSPPLTPGPVSAGWTASSLPLNSVFFWRARTLGAGRYGAWSNSAVRTTDTPNPSGRLVWSQRGAKQFSQCTLLGAAATDTGATMERRSGTALFVRSVGSRAYPDSDYYSIIRVDNQTITGLWWVLGYRFIVGRIDQYSGALAYRAFDVSTAGSYWADSMAAYIRNVANGTYIAITVVYNGSTTNENLLQAIESLGSVNIRQLQYGHAWALISQKGPTGPLMTPIESWSPTGIAICQYQLSNYFSGGLARVISPPIGPAQSWDRLRWSSDTTSPGTRATLRVLGVGGGVGYEMLDTLLTLAAADTNIDLTGVSAASYPQLQLAADLSNTDPQFTPKLQNWRVDYYPPAELATSAWAFRASPQVVTQGSPISVTMDVYNLGYRRADSVRVRFSVGGMTLHEVVIDTIAVGSYRRITPQVPTTGVPLGPQTLVSVVLPKIGDNDLFGGNNSVTFSFTVVQGQKTEAAVKVYFDGRPISDGDYVSTSPVIAVEIVQHDGQPSSQDGRLKLMLDGRDAAQSSEISPASDSPTVGAVAVHEGRMEIRPTLTDGQHELQVYGISTSLDTYEISARSDSLLASIHFNVLAAAALLSVFNYPNPFGDRTNFTFTLTGDRPPDELRIKVYTVAGRIIRDITALPTDVRVGFNTIAWDGKDNEGDEVANGYYFYKIIARVGDKTLTAIQRLTKVR